jgi:hypothetical protein
MRQGTAITALPLVTAFSPNVELSAASVDAVSYFYSHRYKQNSVVATLKTASRVTVAEILHTTKGSENKQSRDNVNRSIRARTCGYP